MSIEKDKFSQMIEKQLNEFEVPFNSDHWDEMSDKLDKIPTGNSGNSGLAKKLIIGTTVAIVVIGGYLLLNKDGEKSLSEQTEKETIKNEVNSQPTTVIKETSNSTEPSKIEKETAASIPSSEIVSKPSKSTDNKEVETKLDKYASHSEQSVKAESKEQVNKMVDKQQTEFIGKSPAIDNPELKTSIIINDEAGCVGESISFSVNRTIDGAKYYWNFGDGGLTSRKASPDHEFKRSGNFTVTLLVSKGEKNDYKVEQKISIKDIPRAEIISQNNQISLNDPYARFECTCSESDKLEWTFNENQKRSGSVVDFLVPEKNTYNVMLTATNQDGCRAAVNYSYHAFKGVKMTVENTITPNGNGSNDVFIPKELTISDVDFTFIVMEASGRIIFETNDKYNPWNGKVNNSGNDLPQGTYLWKVSFTDDRGKLHKQDGAINLIR